MKKEANPFCDGKNAYYGFAEKVKAIKEGEINGAFIALEALKGHHQIAQAVRPGLKEV